MPTVYGKNDDLLLLVWQVYPCQEGAEQETFLSLVIH